MFFGVVFVLYFLHLSAGKGFWFIVSPLLSLKKYSESRKKKLSDSSMSHLWISLCLTRVHYEKQFWLALTKGLVTLLRIDQEALWITLIFIQWLHLSYNWTLYFSQYSYTVSWHGYFNARYEFSLCFYELDGYTLRRSLTLYFPSQFITWV